MPDLPVSGLSTLVSYSTSDLIEVVDVSDTTYAPAGTNKKVTILGLLTMVGLAPPVGVASGGTGLASLSPNAVMLGNGASTPGFATTAVAGNVLTDNGAGVNPSFRALPISNYLIANLASPYNVTSTMASTGLNLTLPNAGTYLITSPCRAYLSVSGGSAGQQVWFNIRLYDITNSVELTACKSQVCYIFLTGAYGINLWSGALGPAFYTVSGPATIQLQVQYAWATALTISSAQMSSDSNGYTSITALQIK